ncbi:hypothetical protein BN7_2615 [Wickerhamomyces ciferrii]|uniref:Uncharacterized protein n=1 Tax=Wickerhamomyces ciferrii (strain ATCC 14091 / BCRC 22168 / CBS 111 / JCM 3599 / NBRC 0793 / NRRL Y-1031 F-60-10) TaxID=1206466 RepID=K0KPI4_WICCF|nr:uncharacterized protein BN7_2615 [Wickerhamomyces ciferrii]CCH43068.1 hypothetical protein BN7_2615 [Wickerhamomyces ciferrii]
MSLFTRTDDVPQPEDGREVLLRRKTLSLLKENIEYKKIIEDKQKEILKLESTLLTRNEDIVKANEEILILKQLIKVQRRKQLKLILKGSKLSNELNNVEPRNRGDDEVESNESFKPPEPRLRDINLNPSEDFFSKRPTEVQYGHTFKNLIISEYSAIVEGVAVGDKFISFDTAEKILFIIYDIINGIGSGIQDTRVYELAENSKTVKRIIQCRSCNQRLALLEFNNFRSPFVYLASYVENHICKYPDIINKLAINFKKKLREKEVQDSKANKKKKKTKSELDEEIVQKWRHQEQLYDEIFQKLLGDVTLFKQYIFISKTVNISSKRSLEFISEVTLRLYPKMMNTNQKTMSQKYKDLNDLVIACCINIMGLDNSEVFQRINERLNKTFSVNDFTTSTKKNEESQLRRNIGNIYNDEFEDSDIISLALELTNYEITMFVASEEKMIFTNYKSETSYGVDQFPNSDQVLEKLNNNIDKAKQEKLRKELSRSTGEHGKENEELNFDLVDEMDEDSEDNDIPDAEKASLSELAASHVDRNESFFPLAEVYNKSNSSTQSFTQEFKAKKDIVDKSVIDNAINLLVELKNKKKSIDLVYFQNKVSQAIWDKSEGCLFLDGTYTKIKYSRYKDNFNTLLVISTRLCNGSSIPIGFALVNNENFINWSIVLETFKMVNFEELKSLKQVRLLSDSQKGLLLSMNICLTDFFEEMDISSCIVHLKKKSAKIYKR